MKRTLAAMVVLLGVGVLPAPAAEADSGPATGSVSSRDSVRCRVPATVGSLGAALPTVKQRLQSGEPVVVIALGSASTAGAGSSSTDASYPVVLERELARRWPDATIKVINKGFAGQRALDMYRRIDTEIIDEKPALVIWQTGVNDAIHDVGLPKFSKVLAKGVAKLQAAGSDVILMDHQYLAFAERFPRYQDYKAAMRDVAQNAQAGLFRRYDVMRFWEASGAFEGGELLGSDGLMVDTGYRCLAVALADAIAAAVTPAEAAATRPLR